MVQGFILHNAFMEIHEDICRSWDSVIIEILNALIGFAGILFGAEAHHMSLQFPVMPCEPHAKAHKKAFQSAAAGEKPFVKTHAF